MTFRTERKLGAIFVMRKMPDGRVAKIAAAIPEKQTRSEVARSLLDARRSLREFTK